jgi:hypothetical protein
MSAYGRDQSGFAAKMREGDGCIRSRSAGVNILAARRNLRVRRGKLVNPVNDIDGREPYKNAAWHGLSFLQIAPQVLYCRQGSGRSILNLELRNSSRRRCKAVIHGQFFLTSRFAAKVNEGY